MSKVFLDLGTHYGQGLRHFIQRFGIDSTWKVHTFEANPLVHQQFTDKFLVQTPYVVSHHAAVSTYDGTITFNVETPPGEGDTGMGSSIISLDSWDPWKNNTSNRFFQRSVTVPCIDLSSFIQQNFSTDDYILIKMDIEGAEYDILERMYASGTLDMVSHLSVEWHSTFFIDQTPIKEREDKLVTILRQKGIALETWI
jgi:FkbM family methyltransferase